MAKRRSDEARMIEYFSTAPIEKAELMLGLVRDIVRKRIAPIRVERVVNKRKRTAKGNASAAVVTNAPEVMAQ